MKRKFLLASVFLALLAGGAISASAVAGKGPLVIQQTVSTSTTGSTTTGSSTDSTTGSTSTGSTSTATTTTVATSTTVATTTTTATSTKTVTTARPAKITICTHVWPKRGSVKHVTKRINRSAWNYYQKRGASLGACNTATAKKFHSRVAHIKRFHRRR